MRTLSLVSVLVLAFAWSGCSDDDDNNCNDSDGDGYGVGDGCDGPDCDDNDSAVFTSIDGYPDADGDGENATTSEAVCTDGTLPSTHSATAGTDCDDSDADVYQEQTAYMDMDGDGIGAATAMAETLCTGADLPANYSLTNTDCNDGDASAFEAVTMYFPDLDGDGECADATMMACTDGTMPMGWCTTAGTDCDDTDPLWQAGGAGDVFDWCEAPGICMDTELFTLTQPDGYGVGACPLGVDCNDASPICNAPVVATTTTCTASNPTECTSDQLCVANDQGTDVCHDIPSCCNNNDTGLYCAQIANTEGTGCAQQCPDLPDDPTGPQLAAYAMCLNACIANARPLAQYLYANMQSCQALAGCLAPGADQVACTLSNCSAQSLACLSHAPAP